MYKKIDVFVNGNYCFSTCAYKTLAEAVKDIKSQGFICISENIFSACFYICENDKVIARYSK